MQDFDVVTNRAHVVAHKESNKICLSTKSVRVMWFDDRQLQYRHARVVRFDEKCRNYTFRKMICNLYEETDHRVMRRRERREECFYVRSLVQICIHITHETTDENSPILPDIRASCSTTHLAVFPLSRDLLFLQMKDCDVRNKQYTGHHSPTLRTSCDEDYLGIISNVEGRSRSKEGT